MTSIVTKSGEPLAYSANNLPQLSELAAIEDLLLKLKEMMSVFEQVIVTLKDNAEVQKYNKKINELLKNDMQNEYINSLKGFYLLINESVDKSQFVFAQDKNIISNLGNQYIKNIRSWRTQRTMELHIDTFRYDSIFAAGFYKHFVKKTQAIETVCLQSTLAFFAMFKTVKKNLNAIPVFFTHLQSVVPYPTSYLSKQVFWASSISCI